jgi:hypothetical protein
MKKTLLLVILAFVSLHFADAQVKTYSVTSGEMIFSMSNVEFTDDFLGEYPNAEMTKTNVRWTVFFHLGQYWHIDFTNNIGLKSGLGIRNVGLITDEKLPEVVGSDVMTNFKIIRRQYFLGIPLALKVGAFDKHMYFFGGAEYELAFLYKEKYWQSHSRDGSKTKSTEWFGNQSPTFIPSVFGGVQLPGGINVQFKWYLNDFLNNNYSVESTAGSPYPVSDLTRYKTSQVFYVSLSWQFNTAYITKKDWQTGTEVAYR